MFDDKSTVAIEDDDNYDRIRNGLYHWTKMSERKPELEDIPFITAEKRSTHTVYDFWDDTDWFDELSEKEYNEWDYWMNVPKRQEPN